ncbi:Histidine kinase [Lishizhenia tianjinensis]|uniref:Histidine kinase n=1 Tax=Lishizhenia tianjinensis TaxID=477690 RepID=A0A1I6YIC6_9FLAO|nr:histidine kinase [Lishizhenia tianjinensis]SFT50279.1 Histidine kinase [Lishizhenia tianjinensis]
MFKASGLYWVFQLLGWGAFGIILMIIIYTSETEGLDTENILYVSTMVILFIVMSHLLRTIFIKFNWLNLKFLPLLARVMPTCILISYLFLLSITLFEFMMLGEMDDSIEFLDFSIKAVVYSIFFMSWSTFYITYHLVNKSRVQELENLKLNASQTEIELKNLREQLNPHFLFNSLNSIRALIDLEPSTAKTSVTTLSNLLRNSLQMGKKSNVTLSEELDLCKRYLELEGIRFEERLRVIWNVNAPMDIVIPPFIIQTQVENAIKHGISKSIDGGDVFVGINYTQENLNIKVENTGRIKNGGRQGIGIENTKRRLFLHYKQNASFNLTEENDRVRAEININFSNT